MDKKCRRVATRHPLADCDLRRADQQSTEHQSAGEAGPISTFLNKYRTQMAPGISKPKSIFEDQMTERTKESSRRLLRRLRAKFKADLGLDILTGADKLLLDQADLLALLRACQQMRDDVLSGRQRDEFPYNHEPAKSG
jgi:hypothetical protein